MKSNAAGQLLGYTIQYPRALVHLLRSGPGDVVSIEVLGDVATKTRSEGVLTEEDKSSLSSKPITDRSSDLWKTFHNWIMAIKDGVLNKSTTQYILYCNKAGRPSIVDKFSSAITINDAKAALLEAKDKLTDITSEHNIWGYYDYVVNQNENLLLEVICRFEVQYGIYAGYDDVNLEIRKKHVPLDQIDFLRDKISGWMLKIIQERIAKNELAMIPWEDFDHQFSVVFQGLRKRELLDFTLESPPKAEDIDSQIKIHPRYIRQLDFIGCSDDEIVAAVSDYLRADVNRHIWIEQELIDVDNATDFTNKLKSYWSTQKKIIGITNSSLGEEEKGQLLLEKCRSRQETIWGLHPPHPTIIGTYHALAEEPVLGWHPTWENLLSDHEEI